MRTYLKPGEMNDLFTMKNIYAIKNMIGKREKPKK